MLINPHFGLQILLGEIVTDMELEPDEPMETQCNDCNECVMACPTRALASDGTFNAAKCISYLTCEHPGSIQDTLAEKIDIHLFGCDECILACPYNQNAPVCANRQFRFFSERQRISLERILSWNPAEFDKHFADSAIQRLGLERLKRNAQICLKNT